MTAPSGEQERIEATWRRDLELEAARSVRRRVVRYVSDDDEYMIPVSLEAAIRADALKEATVGESFLAQFPEQDGNDWRIIAGALWGQRRGWRQRALAAEDALKARDEALSALAMGLRMTDSSSSEAARIEEKAAWEEALRLFGGGAAAVSALDRLVAAVDVVVSADAEVVSAQRIEALEELLAERDRRVHATEGSKP
jgi:hypothetical protein